MISPPPVYFIGQADELLETFVGVAVVSSDQPRSRVVQSLVNALNPEQVWHVGEEAGGRNIVVNGSPPISLRAPDTIDAMVSGVSRLTIDVGSLRLPVWTALMASSQRTGTEVRAIYTESASYRRAQPSDPSQDLFQLTSRAEGLRDVPGLLRLRTRSRGTAQFVALLGFEGRRLAYLKDALPIDDESLVPVIGRPGYQIEFVEAALVGNALHLRDSQSIDALRYVQANCPFAAFNLINELGRDGEVALQIAPIGTEPHALGAIMYALTHPRATEILYDHPVPHPDRSVTEGRTLLYLLDQFAPWREA